MYTVDFLIFNKKGEKLKLNLVNLISIFINKYKDVHKIKFEEKSNTLFFSCNEFDLSFPIENNRISVSANKNVCIDLIILLENFYNNSGLCISTPGYEKFIEIDVAKNLEEIKKLLGVN